MKKPTGKNSWRIMLLSIALAASCSCTEDTYTTKLVYENTLQQNLKLEFYRDYHAKEVETTLNIAPEGSASTEITVYDSEGIFEYIYYIRITFDDGKSILYQKNGFDKYESPTSLMNLSNYSRSQEEVRIRHIKITEDHYREAIESEDKKGDSKDYQQLIRSL